MFGFTFPPNPAASEPCELLSSANGLHLGLIPGKSDHKVETDLRGQLRYLATTYVVLYYLIA